jgi:hypothetical protein
MNAYDERGSDSKNFGAKTAEIGVMVVKNGPWKLLGAKWSFHEGSGGFP